MFTIPKDKIDSVMRSLSPSVNARTRHEGRNHSDTQTSSVSSVNRNSASRSEGRIISYDEKPQYVSPDNEGTRYNSYQALQSGSHSTQDAINRYREGFDSQGNRNYGYDQTGRTPESTYDNRNNLPLQNRQTEARYQTNRIPDTGFQNPGYSKGASNQIYDRTQPQTEGGYQQYYGNQIDSRKPELIVPDTIDEVNFRWTISGFTECSTSCGGGKLCKGEV